ncbi:MAG: thioredoxin family protein [Myxococcota bacterium]|nr:thioredoxin family protein [Myxococcota bacterium]
MELSDFDDLRQDSPRLAVWLTRPACGPANALLPFIEQTFSQDGWRFVEVDLNDSPEVGGQLLVFATPTLLLFVDGQEKQRLSRIFTRDAVVQARERLS